MHTAYCIHYIRVWMGISIYADSFTRVCVCTRLSISTFSDRYIEFATYKLAHIDRNIDDYSCHENFQSESVRSWGHFDDNEWRIVIEGKCLKNFFFFSFLLLSAGFYTSSGIRIQTNTYIILFYFNIYFCCFGWLCLVSWLVVVYIFGNDGRWKWRLGLDLIRYYM